MLCSIVKDLVASMVDGLAHEGGSSVLSTGMAAGKAGVWGRLRSMRILGAGDGHPKPMNAREKEEGL